MTKIQIKRFIVNGIIALSLLTLFITAFTTINRQKASNAYEALATLRQLEKPREPLVQVEEEAILPQYTYQANANATWLDMNPHYSGWVTLAGTNINYPYVRSEDNLDYLSMDFYQNPSDAGAIFMDYRNLGNFNDQHTILYGHYMTNKTMFHNLTLFHDEAFFLENTLIEISGLYETKYYRIFSVYEISADDYTLAVSFHTNEHYTVYLDRLKSLSIHTPTFEPDSTAKLLSLVTCSHGIKNGRTIVHAIEQKGTGE